MKVQNPILHNMAHTYHPSNVFTASKVSNFYILLLVIYLKHVTTSVINLYDGAVI